MRERATSAPDPDVLVDRQGRRICYLRLSLTDRCNFRCSYCSPGGPESREPPLSRSEIARLVGALAPLGIRRVRLTGGEPTLRRDLLAVVEDVRAIAGIEEIALTTNGLRLEEMAGRLRAAGVSRLNVSLDTLRGERLTRIAGRGAGLERIARGIDAAAHAGFMSLKVNTVVIRGVNEDELGDLARFAWRRGAIARFIELMPFGDGDPVPTAEVKRLLAAQGVDLAADATRGWGPAYHMRGISRDREGPVSGLVGFISAMTESFCGGCNRIRVGPDGALRACLGGRSRVHLRDLLRSNPEPSVFADRIRQALSAKADGHEMAAGRSSGPLLPMVGIGG